MCSFNKNCFRLILLGTSVWWTSEDIPHSLTLRRFIQNSICFVFQSFCESLLKCCCQTQKANSWNQNRTRLVSTRQLTTSHMQPCSFVSVVPGTRRSLSSCNESNNGVSIHSLQPHRCCRPETSSTLPFKSSSSFSASWSCNVTSNLGSRCWRQWNSARKTSGTSRCYGTDFSPCERCIISYQEKK